MIIASDYDALTGTEDNCGSNLYAFFAVGEKKRGEEGNWPFINSKHWKKSLETSILNQMIEGNHAVA